MDKAVFITHPDYVCRKYKNPWDDNGYALGRYNCKELPFEPYNGILNILKKFEISNAENVKKVTVKASALGIFDMFLNGKRIGSDEYKPGWTDYKSRLFLWEYDVTEYVKASNIFTAEVSSGWWSGRISYGVYGFLQCAFIAEITVSYADGTADSIVTGTDWQTSLGGPVMRADIWDGEYYDARIPHVSVCPQAHIWKSATVFNGFEGELMPVIGTAVRPKYGLERTPCEARLICGVRDNGSDFGEVNVVGYFKEKACFPQKLVSGTSVIFDMGQNIVGRPVISLKAGCGTKIHVYFGEMLNDSGKAEKGNDGPNGSIYMSNYRSALSRITYIASGNGEETYFPRHSFFGFRYVEFEAEGEAYILSVRGEVLGADMTETGDFKCDAPDINKLYSNILWGMRGNYFSVPTDCPQRDERFGWSGDAQLFCGAASYMSDIRAFMRKWLGDMRDSQRGLEGAYCDTAPRVLTGEINCGNAAWADAGIIVPYKLWQMYGDTEIIAEHYSSMEQYMKYVSRFGLDGAKDFYGDWLAYEKTDNRLIATAYYAYDAFIMEKLSRVLGFEERAKYYGELHRRVKKHWNEKYLCNGELTVKTQTAYAIGIVFGLFESDVKQRMAMRLSEKIKENGYKLSTGFVGTALLCGALSSCELDNTCYSLVLQTEDPSWLYSVKQGATTVWERWNSYTFEKGFGNATMNSFNHYAYGAVAKWFYSGICGILPNSEIGGFSHFTLCPSPDLRDDADIPEGQKRILCAEATYNSLWGTVKSAWENQKGTLAYSFVIPDGTNADVKLLSDVDTVFINGAEHSARREGKRVCFTLGEGEYFVKINKKEKAENENSKGQVFGSRR